MNTFNYLFANSGNYLLLLIFLIILVSSLLTNNYKLAIRSVLTALIVLGIGTLIKNYFYLPRPFIWSGNPSLIGYLSDGSFPSDHTALAFGLSLPFFYHRRRPGVLLLFFSILVAVSRVVAGVHTFGDILGGFVLALLLTLVTHNARLLKIWHFH